MEKGNSNKLTRIALICTSVIDEGRGCATCAATECNRV